MRANRPIKNKLRTFRMTTDVDHLLVQAAESVQVDVSRLLRDFVVDGTQQILTDNSVRDTLRRRYAI